MGSLTSGSEQPSDSDEAAASEEAAAIEAAASSEVAVAPNPSNRSGVSLQGALGWFLLSYGIGVVGYLGLYAIASRFLGTRSFGAFVIAITATTVVGQLALLGAHRAGLREAARLTRDDTDELATLRLGVRAVCFVSLPLGGLLTGIATWFLEHGQPPHDRLILAIGAGLLTVLSGHQKLWANYLRGFGYIRFAAMLEGRAGGALPAIFQTVLVALEWIIVPQWGLPGALAAAALGYLIPILIGWRVVGRQWRHVPVTPHLLADLRRVLERDWRFASGQLAAYLNSNLELWMAGFLLSAVGTSLFGAAQRLSLLAVTPLTSIQVVFSPVIARVGRSNDRRKLENLVRTGATIAAIPMLVILVPMLVTPNLVLREVFGPKFSGGAIVLMLLTLGSMANVLTGLCGAVLSMTHREGVVAVIQWIGFGVRFLTGIGAGLLFGLNGLGASAGFVTAGIWIALWVAVHRVVGVHTHLTIRPRIRLLRETSG